ncbi:MAG: hypothetical protein PF637_13470 [Spirochaetes bacterium]|jgi:hypothetical protein|nr:hypothetical protein [Spirochaetota bacterium]
MKNRTILCLTILFTVSFLPIKAESKNRISAGVGYASFNTIIYVMGHTASVAINSAFDDLDDKKEKNTDVLSAGIVYQASYDRMIFKHFAVGLNYNYENIHTKIYYYDGDSSENNIKIHTIMPRIKLIYGFKNLKVYHGLGFGVGIYDETLTEKIDSQTFNTSMTTRKPAIHATIAGLELHLTKGFYIFADAGVGFAGFANFGAGYMF